MSGDNEVVDWRSKKTFTEQLWGMYEAQHGTDLNIVISGDGEKVFRCHSLIYQRLVTEEIDVQPQPTIFEDIGEIDPEVFEVILRFGYTDELKAKDLQELIAVSRVAKIFNMNRVSKECDWLIELEVSADNIWYLIDCMNDDEPKLQDLARRVLAENIDVCLKSPKFKDCSLKALEFVLDQEELSVPEMTLIQSVVLWAKNREPNLNAEKSKQLLGPCLGKIRFLSLTSGQFNEITQKHELLPPGDCLSILVSIITKQVSHLPDYICKLDTPRTVVNRGHRPNFRWWLLK